MAAELRSLRYTYIYIYGGYCSRFIHTSISLFLRAIYVRFTLPLTLFITGTVTASPSPLGLSLTPPPTLGGSLGGLVGGASRVSAAPGAEAKFRASAVPALTANGVFGSSSSLFPNLVGKPGRGGTTSIGDKNAGGRSRLLEDFRNNRYVIFELSYSKEGGGGEGDTVLSPRSQLMLRAISHMLQIPEPSAT